MVYISTYGETTWDFRDASVDVAIAVWYWGEYIDKKALTEGIRIKTTSYTRHHINDLVAFIRFDKFFEQPWWLIDVQCQVLDGTIHYIDLQGAFTLDPGQNRHMDVNIACCVIHWGFLSTAHPPV